MPLCRGAVEPWAELCAVLLALLALLLATVGGAMLPRSALVLFGILGVCMLQLVPLPAIVHSVAPGALRVFEVSLSPLGLYPSTRPLSLDPSASTEELAKAVACTAAFTAAWGFANDRRRRERLLLALALAGVGVAAVALGAALIGAGPLLAPRFPFVNPNHLAGLLNLSAFVALGLALRAHAEGGRVLYLIAFAAVGALSLLSLSRAGIAAFLFGAALFVAIWVRSHGREQRSASPTRHLLLGGAIAAAVGTAAYLAVDPVIAEMRTVRGARDDVKVQLLGPALQLVGDFPLLGVGRGAFGSAFSAYRLESSPVTFTHLENEWLQGIAELGVPAGLALIGTFAWIWLSAARRRDLSTAEMGLLAGTGALAAQNAFDFSLEILGVSVPFAVAMGLLSRGGRPVTARPWALHLAIAVALVVALGGLAIARAHGGETDPARVAAAASGRAAADAAREAARWHPADWLPHATAGARLASEGRCAAAMPWLLRAMALAPSAPAPHLATARCLAGRDDFSAKREYRLAISLGSPALPEAAARYPALPDLFEIAPSTPDGLISLGDVLVASRAKDAEAAYRRALDEFFDDRALLPLARVRASQGDPAGALAFARRHSAQFPSDASGWRIAAAALAELGREDDARAEIQNGLAAIPGSHTLIGFLVERAMTAHRFSEAHRLAEEIAARTPAEIAGKHLLAARALAGQGRIAEALDRARSAAATEPDAVWALLALAGYAADARRYDEAVAALRHAAALPGTTPGSLDARITQLEAELKDEQRRMLERKALGGEPAR